LKVWGITGGIASGKSTAAKFFAQEGIPVIDADQIARALSEEGGAAYPKILARFGTADRARIREIVFRDPAARTELEAILHPLIVQESQRQLDLLSAENKTLALYEATLLVETGRYKTLDGLIVVDCPRELRRQRLVTHRGLSGEMADRILDAQIPDETRRKAATRIIENSGTLTELQQKVHEFLVEEGILNS
jgi:dephospho-CoA kinase